MNAFLLAMLLMSQSDPVAPFDATPAPSFENTSDVQLLIMAIEFMKRVTDGDGWERWAAAAALLLFVLAFRRHLLDVPQKYMRILGLSAAAVPGVLVHVADPKMPLDKALTASFAIWLMAVGGWAGVVKLSAEVWADAQVWWSKMVAWVKARISKPSPQEGPIQPGPPGNDTR